VEYLERVPWYAIVYVGVIYAAAISFGHLISKREDLRTLSTGRFGTIDGLRGLLAIGVFIHHSFAAYIFFTVGRWSWSESSILNQLGQSTVAIFFMITGFLFYIKAESRSINWGRFYLGRLVRLAPLYIVFVAVVVLLVFAHSSWEIRVGPGELVSQVLRWLAFVCFGRPDINDYRDTWILVAGVNWSLAYEVYFYFLVFPVLHVGCRLLGAKKMSMTVCAVLIAFLLCRGFGWLRGGNSLYLSQFLAGAAVAFLKDLSYFRGIRAIRVLWISAVLSLIILGFKNDARDVISLVCAAVVLLACARGVSAFGILKFRGALWLGEISYGIYLLHGILLVGALNLLTTVVDLSKLTLVAYSGIVIFVLFLVILIASISFRLMERPAMQRFRLRFGS
jgi:peptidoglycan/LPS O-acetylase OafA/YrhL